VDGIRLVVGLGNPGSRYERTRHNAGFLVVERILAAGGGRWSRIGRDRLARDEAVVRIGPRDLLLVRPLAFMNHSGEPVKEVLLAHGLESAVMLVVVDDVALPPGRLRLRLGGGSGGHNGLRSIREFAGPGDHPRLRIGIGAPPGEIDLVDFVLEPLAGNAWNDLEMAVAAAVEAVEMICLRGLTAAMDVFNRDRTPRVGSRPREPGGTEVQRPLGPDELSTRDPTVSRDLPTEVRNWENT
jgi:peptidyl-tRNA hydrolase, PTH1 family